LRVLVTGGSGFIGSHVVDRLLAGGHEVRVYDLVPSGWHHADQVDSVVGDILDAPALRRGMLGCDAVIHLAAVADVDEVALDPLRADLVNTRGTAVMLEAARQEGIRHVVYGSTIWVYGNVAGDDPLDEDVLLAPPEHFYTATKLAGETYCRSYGRMFGLAPTILRFGIPHGPRARPTTVVARFVARALAGESLSINGDGNQTRQFIYVEDLAGGVVASLTEAARGRTFNLVGEQSVSVLEVAAIVSELIGNVSIVHLPGRPADLSRVVISSQRAWDELGWRPSTAFAEGVARYVASLAATNGSPSASTASMIAGKAPTVLRQEFGAL
jgi:UDP-glucose 4-epimerase